MPFILAPFYRVTGGGSNRSSRLAIPSQFAKSGWLCLESRLPAQAGLSYDRAEQGSKGPLLTQVHGGGLPWTGSSPVKKVFNSFILQCNYGILQCINIIFINVVLSKSSRYRAEGLDQI